MDTVNKYIVTNEYNVGFPLLMNFRLNELRNTNKVFHNESSVCKGLRVVVREGPELLWK